MAFKNKEAQRKWKESNPEKVREYAYRHYQRHKEKRRKYISEWYWKRKREIFEALHKKCHSCDATKQLVIHKKDGQSHVWGCSNASVA